jgi:hypothetical protein
MILSHRHRFIFLKTRKVAGTSVEMALSKYCGPDDIITPFGGRKSRSHSSLEDLRAPGGRPVARNYRKPIAEYALSDLLRLKPWRKPVRKYYEHIPASILAPMLPEDVWRDYLKVSIIRNPFDFAVSDYFWHKKFKGFEGTFEDFLEEMPKALRINEVITQIDGRNVVDVMMRYETLGQDLTALSERLGLDADLGRDFKELAALSGVRPAQARTEEMYRDLPGGVRRIEDLCEATIRTYGYKMDA